MNLLKAVIFMLSMFIIYINIPDHMHDNRDQGDLYEPSDRDHEHNDARSPRQEVALLEVCQSRHLADDDDLDDDDDDEKGREEVQKDKKDDKSPVEQMNTEGI